MLMLVDAQKSDASQKKKFAPETFPMLHLNYQTSNRDPQLENSMDFQVNHVELGRCTDCTYDTKCSVLTIFSPSQLLAVDCSVALPEVFIL